MTIDSRHMPASLLRVVARVGDHPLLCAMPMQLRWSAYMSILNGTSESMHAFSDAAKGQMGQGFIIGKQLDGGRGEAGGGEDSGGGATGGAANPP